MWLSHAQPVSALVSTLVGCAIHTSFSLSHTTTIRHLWPAVENREKKCTVKGLNEDVQTNLIETGHMLTF